MALQRLPDARFEFPIGAGLENLMADIYAYLEFLPDTVAVEAKAALAPLIEQHVRELHARGPTSAADISPSRFTKMAEADGVAVQVVVVKHF